MALNYSTLQTQILNYAQKQPYDPIEGSGDQNFYQAIPFFINLATEKIYRDVGVLERNVMNSTSFTISAGNPTIPRPTDWQSTISIMISPQQINSANYPIAIFPLFKRTFEFCRNWANQGSGTPKFYSDSSSYSFIYLSPIPDNTYYYQLIYETSPPTLSTSPSAQEISAFNNTWLMQTYPSLLFYAAYMEALRYMGKGDEIPIYQGLYEQTIQSINRQNTLRNVDRTADLAKV